MAVVDAFDAMTTNRAYRPVPDPGGRGRRSCGGARGTHFDPEVVEAFLRAFRDVSALPISI